MPSRQQKCLCDVPIGLTVPNDLRLFKDESIVRLTTEAVSLGVLIIVVVVSVVDALTDPNCGTTCQQTLLSGSMAFIAVGLMVCCCTQNDYGYAPCDGSPRQ